MSAAEVRIVKADSSFVATFTGPSGYVACTVEATPTTQYHLEVMKFDYVTETMPAFTPVAGRVYQYSVGIAPVERPGETYSDWGRWVTYSDHWQMNGNEWWGFYRNFHNRYDMFYVDKLGTRYVNWLNAYENGLGFQFECAAWAIDLDTPLGAIDVGAKIPTPYTNATRANARVDAIELVDSYTGHVLWKNQDQWYSHTKASEENVNVFDLVDSGHPDGVAVTWSTLEVWQWVTVNKAVQGKEGAAGYEHSDYQHWTNADQAVVIWTPSTNSMRIEPWVRDP
jgi:hypothetical protein